jgi:hypothetical protein
VSLLTLYDELTHLVGDETGATDTLLHVHAGMVLLFLARIVTRRSLASWLPFSVVLTGALINEVVDWRIRGSVLMPDTLVDIVNTIFWPLLLMIGLRLRGSREPQNRARIEHDSASSRSAGNPRRGQHSGPIEEGWSDGSRRH